MGTFVLDASIAVAWCFPGDPTESTPYSRLILSRLAIDNAVVPEIWGFEVANCIFVPFSKRKRITEQQIKEYLQLLKALPIHVETRDLWSTVNLEASARKWSITPYDAAYVDLALRHGLPLATADSDFEGSSQRSRGQRD